MGGECPTVPSFEGASTSIFSAFSLPSSSGSVLLSFSFSLSSSFSSFFSSGLSVFSLSADSSFSSVVPAIPVRFSKVWELTQSLSTERGGSHFFTGLTQSRDDSVGRLALLQGLLHVFHVGVQQGGGHLVLNFGELLHGGLCGGCGYPRVHNGGQESHSGHDGIAGLAERDWLVVERTQRATAAQLSVFEEWVLDRETEEVEDALVLRPGADMLAHFVPVVLEKCRKSL